MREEFSRQPGSDYKPHVGSQLDIAEFTAEQWSLLKAISFEWEKGFVATRSLLERL